MIEVRLIQRDAVYRAQRTFIWKLTVATFEAKDSYICYEVFKKLQYNDTNTTDNLRLNKPNYRYIWYFKTPGRS